jgi:hypothetical protein
MKIQVFESLVFPEPNTGCFIWAGRVDKSGYGRVSNKMGNLQVAHRLSYFFYKGEFDRKMCVLHTCDNPTCVNPMHLYLGDQKQNNIDRDVRKRQRTKHGSDHKLAKLNEAKVLRIRSLHNVKTNPSRQLAVQFGVSQKLIMNIINRKAWTHI